MSEGEESIETSTQFLGFHCLADSIGEFLDYGIPGSGVEKPIVSVGEVEGLFNELAAIGGYNDVA
jgi:hypothetical protein